MGWWVDEAPRGFYWRPPSHRPVPSRRACLAALTSAFAGCSAGAWRSAEVATLPIDHPAMAWAVRLPEPARTVPTIDHQTGRLYVAAGDPPSSPGDRVNRSGSGRLLALRTADGSAAWGARTDAPIVERPLVHGGRVYTATGYSNGWTAQDTRIVAFDDRGRQQWSTGPWDGRREILAAGGDSVFVGTDDDESFGDTLFAIGRDGDVRWGKDADDAGPARVVDGRLLSGSPDGGFAAYELADGTMAWRTDGEPVGNPVLDVVAVDGLYFTQPAADADDEAPLVARSTIDGAEQWRFSGPGGRGDDFAPSGVAAIPGSDGHAGAPRFVTTESAGVAYGLDATSGERWRFGTDGPLSQGPVVGDVTYLVDDQRIVYAVDPDDGSERWRASFEGYPWIQPLADGGVMISLSGSGRNVVASFGSDGDERWQYATSEGVLLAPSIGRSRIYVPAISGTLGDPATLRGSLLAFEA